MFIILIYRKGTEAQRGESLAQGYTDSNPVVWPWFCEALSDHMMHRWLDQGRQKTLVGAIPVAPF